jgi:hypothetical protein
VSGETGGVFMARMEMPQGRVSNPPWAVFAKKPLSGLFHPSKKQFYRAYRSGEQGDRCDKWIPLGLGLNIGPPLGSAFP